MITCLITSEFSISFLYLNGLFTCSDLHMKMVTYNNQLKNNTFMSDVCYVVYSTRMWTYGKHL